MKKSGNIKAYLYHVTELIPQSFSCSGKYYTVVDILTNQGVMTMQLAGDKAPITVNNFLTYVDEGFYTKTEFHRVINEFMIQGGALILI